ncbi:cobalamin-binding protein [Mucilaginibacter arboris]|uniref:ABC transporter substrate-binding protein n=1 Tax=Mucilaginibacter arboris TaxID=2682090 RepID=A0A7K1SW94_9SPHI|nr:cobalamin-binding protein [Mucilaginibacter arboris]MVN21563.1 ABC transporter substrate-binding protein [Mucilaginibacter arboris]
MDQKRIISLLAAGTEIVCELGLEDQLVGRSHECDYPETILNLPVCSSAMLDPHASSLEIDKQVKGILTDALSFYQIDRELIKSLKPDVIITQTQCEVCAVSLSEVEKALENLLDGPVTIISLEPDNVNAVFNDIKTVSEILGVPDRGADLTGRMHERMNLVKHKLKFITQKPKVACVEWIEPLMMAGNWTPEMVEIAGGQSVLAVSGKRSPAIDWLELLHTDPEIVVIMPCGFSIERTLKEMGTLLELPHFNDLQAIKNDKLFIADRNQYFNRSGPRIVDSVEILAEIINPKQFIFGYEGEGWIKFSL